MASRKKDISYDSAAIFSPGQIVTVVLGYPDGGSETIHRAVVIAASGPLVKLRKEEKETVVNTTGLYFIKAAIEE